MRERMAAEEPGEMTLLDRDRREEEEEEEERERRKEAKLKSRRADPQRGVPKTEEARRKLEEKRIRAMMPVQGFIHAGLR